jgi:hypothetical protein
MAPYKGAQMAKRKLQPRNQRTEPKMQPNETPPEANEPTAENIQAFAENETATREAADLEERLSAQRVAQARNESEAAGKEMERNENVLGSLAAQGRDRLLAKLREHASKPKPAYVPPPMTDRQRERLEEEMNAGAKAVARAQAQQVARPIPPRDPREPGPSTPVHRPDNVVPDPILRDTTGFAAGTKVYSPDV